MFNIHKLCL